MAFSGASALVFLLLGMLGSASGWKECSVKQEDRWMPGLHSSLPRQMRREYRRMYTCASERGSLAAASFSFASECTARTFTTPEIRSCLKGRRVIFLGDSLSNQQGDSLVGMLGWHPSFLNVKDPRSEKWKISPEGYKVPSLLECWRQPVNGVGRLERCYDLYGSSFPSSQETHHSIKSFSGGKRKFTHKFRRGESQDQHLRRLSLEEDVAANTIPAWEDEEDTSVHMRMFPQPTGEDWFARAVADYNTTRPSDIFVVNFGAHYKDDSGDEAQFKSEMSALLDGMATLGETATVVWREIAPTHFPSVNGSYDSFERLPASEKKDADCTGTPPAMLDRNVWVDDYLKDNGLTDRVKVLRIYRMSTFRGAAHRTCHIEQPAMPEYYGESPTRAVYPPPSGKPTDCRHWSEPGVVEEWNKLMLNHVCPA